MGNKLKDDLKLQNKSVMDIKSEVILKYFSSILKFLKLLLIKVTDKS